MMRSMFSGVSGLRAHQSRMDVVGNNIANVNTVGFKSGRVTFQEVFSQTLKGAGAPDAATGRGGTNPMQVGLGMGVGAVDTLMTRGSVQRTDNPTDLSIEGEGFFVLKGGSGVTAFSRAGNFGIDKLGNLVAGNGMNVQGWQNYTVSANGTVTFDSEKPLENINLYSDTYRNKRVISAQATKNIVSAGNLDATKSVIAAPTVANSQFKMPVTVYDKLGNAYKISVNFWKTNVATPTPTTSGTTATTWQWNVDSTMAPAPVNPGDPTHYLIPFDSAGTTALGPQSLNFDINGNLVGSGSTAITLKPQKAGVAPALPATTNETGTDSIAVTLDFSKLTNFSSDSSVKPTNVDGYPTGNLVTFNVGSDGILTGIYSNGKQQPLGMVALATFENPTGLQKIGENLYMPTTNSGDFKKGVKPGSEGAGSLNPGTLEMSNVDLSKEFTEMIVTQRGFQANSRIITTSDEMLQELVNLKR